MKKLTVSFIPTQLPGITMYRYENFIKHMKKDFRIVFPDYRREDVDVPAWEHFALSTPSMLNDLQKMTDASDVVIFQRTTNPNPLIISLIEAMKKRKPSVLVGMELDDYPFDVPIGNPGKASVETGAPLNEMARAQMTYSDFMIVSTDYLKKMCLPFNRNVYVVENCMDMEWWGKSKNKKNDKITIGWTGSGTHKYDIAMLEPVMNKLLDKYGNVIQFKLFTPVIDIKEREGIVVDKKPVNLNKYPEKVKSMGLDIGVVPLLDNHFNRSKSNIRYLELSMLGIPSVCSDIGGQFNETIEEGKNGYLARNCKEFEEKLSFLIEHEEARKSIGKAALDTVKTRFNSKLGAKKYVETIKQIRRTANGFPNTRKSSIATVTGYAG